MSDSLVEQVVAYYTEEFREDSRLTEGARPVGRLEWARTREILGAVLPPAPARLLDVGGGPGVHARALAADGYAVRLLDLTPAHVAQARDGDVPLDAEVADARDLPEPDGRYDAVLLMGPLYHLPARRDRVRALREAVRVARPGGVVVAAAISRYAGPLDFASSGSFDGAWVERTERLATDGVNDVRGGFTIAYFHRVVELVAECTDAGLPEVTVHGVEGPAWVAAEAAAGGPLAEDVLGSALRLARAVDTERELVAASAHLLAVGRVPA